MLQRETPLPLVKRPFPEEPLGGWLGRVAGFYKMDIDELAANFGLDLGFDDECRDWLILPPQPSENLVRIGYLTRIEPNALRALEVDPSWRAPRHVYRFCRKCLFVNQGPAAIPAGASGRAAEGLGPRASREASSRLVTPVARTRSSSVI